MAIIITLLIWGTIVYQLMANTKEFPVTFVGIVVILMIILLVERKKVLRGSGSDIYKPIGYNLIAIAILVSFAISTKYIPYFKLQKQRRDAAVSLVNSEAVGFRINEISSFKEFPNDRATVRVIGSWIGFMRLQRMDSCISFKKRFKIENPICLATNIQLDFDVNTKSNTVSLIKASTP